MQWILLSENWSPLPALHPSIRRAGDLCRPQPTREQCAVVSFYPAISFSLSHTHTVLYMKSYLPVQSAEWRLLTLTPTGGLAFAAKPKCRPLTWWMVLYNKSWALHSTPRVIAVLKMPDLRCCWLSGLIVNFSPLEAGNLLFGLLLL